MLLCPPWVHMFHKRENTDILTSRPKQSSGDLGAMVACAESPRREGSQLMIPALGSDSTCPTRA